MPTLNNAIQYCLINIIVSCYEQKCKYVTGLLISDIKAILKLTYSASRVTLHITYFISPTQSTHIK